MKFLFISPLVWNFYKYREQELPCSLSKREIQCVFLNPVRYKNWQKGSVRLQDYSDNPVPENVSVVERKTSLRKSLFSFIHEIFDNVRQIKKNKPDVVICSDHLMGIPACIYCHRKGIKFIFDNTDDWSEVDKGVFTHLYWKQFARFILRKYSFAITSTSHDQADFFSKKNKRTFVIPNGKPLEFINLINLLPEAEETKKVNFIGSLRDWYDFQLMFDVFSEFPELELNIYGLGELYPALLERSKAYKNIHIRGNASTEKLPILLKESLFGIVILKNIKLNNSTCPIKLFDYWSAGKAVITSPLREIKAIAGENVLYVENKKEFKEAISKVMNDKDFRLGLGQKGYEQMMSNFNYNKITDEFLKIINL